MEESNLCITLLTFIKIYVIIYIEINIKGWLYDMKFELIKPIIPHYSVTEQILTNRGIKKADIPHYLHTTDKDVNDPSAFGEELMKEAAVKLITNIQLGHKCFIVVDSDCDGFTSAALLINYLHDVFPSWVENNLEYGIHTGKQHGLSDFITSLLAENYSLVIVPDAGSNDTEYCKKLVDNVTDIIILDHHICDIENPYATIINNQNGPYPNKELSGVGVTWQFCRYLDELLEENYADQYLDLVALGNDADMMSLQSLETKHLINKGFENVKNPFIYYMADKNSYSLGDKLTAWGVAFYIAPFVNAMVRSGEADEKKLLFESMLKHKAFQRVPSTKRGHKQGDTELLVEQAIRVATNVKNRQNKAQDESMAFLENMIQERNLLNHKVLVLCVKPGEINRNIAGLVANKFMAKYQRPCCILTHIMDEEIQDPEAQVMESVYQGSARGCDMVGITEFKSICESTGCCSFTAGHEGAFGLAIPYDNLEAFVDKTDEILKDMADEPVYKCDYIIDKTNYLTEEQALELASLNNLWGKDMPEAQIGVYRLEISPDDITVYRKRGITMKIIMPGGIDGIIKWATEEDYENLVVNNNKYGNLEINFICTCSENEWGGEVRPQYIIKDWEIIKSNKFIF